MKTILLVLPLLLAACSKPSPVEPPGAMPQAAVAPATTHPAAVADYLAALEAVEKATAPVSLEPLLTKAEAAQQALMEVTGDEAVLERYSAAEFAGLQAQLRGLVLHRDMDIYAQPEPGFLLGLAKAHGRPEDIAFFTTYAATWGPDLVPVYLKLRPQPTPCVRFGEDKIAPLYAAWRDNRSQYPEAYASWVAQNLGDLEEAVALGTCACDGVDSVRREQAAFLKAFPDTPKAGEITARRKQLADEPDALPVNCR